MKRNPFTKAICRQPVRSLLILLLIGAITYGITSHVVEYIAVLNVTNKLEKYYKPIGKLDSDIYDVTSGRELVSQSLYVEQEDLRRSCSGVMEGIYNADIDGVFGHVFKSYVNDVIFTGVLQNKKITELKEIKYVERGNNPDEYIAGRKDAKLVEYQFTFKVAKVEAAYPDYLSEGDLVFINYVTNEVDEFEEEYNALQTDEQYLIRAYYSEHFEDFSKNAPGQAVIGNPGKWFVLDKLTDNQYFYHIAEGADVSLSDEKLDGLNELVEIIKENQRSMMVVGTKDMSLIPDFHISSKRYYLVEGRFLDREDDLNKNKVCVVSSFFARMRGLKVGDKIKLKLRNMDGTSYGYIIHLNQDDWNNWKSYETEELELEIVGLYGEVSPDGTLFTTYTNYLYIPDSCMPVNFVLGMLEMVNPYFYSFALKSSQDQELFLAQNRKALENMGITVSFVNNKADSFAITARNLRRTSKMSLWIFTVTFIPAIELIVIIFVSQRRKEYAIARAMGVSKRTANSQVGAAAVLIGLPGIILGGIAAWIRTIEKVRDNFKEFTAPTGADSISFIPAYWLLLIIISIFIIFIVSIITGASIIANRSILELLQGQARRDKKLIKQVQLQNKNIELNSQAGAGGDKKASPDRIGKHIYSVGIPALAYQETLEKLRWKRLAASMRQIYRHMIRSYGKSLLMLVITGVFITTFGWLYWTIQKNLTEADRLYSSVVIDGEIYTYTSSNYGGGIIKPLYVEAVMNSGLVKESYLEATALADSIADSLQGEKSGTKIEATEDANDTEVAILAVTDWNQFICGTGNELTLDFLQDYNGESLIQDEGKEPVVIISKMKMMELGKKPGDFIYLTIKDKCIGCRIIGSYLGSLSKGYMKNPVIMSEYQMSQLTDQYYYMTARFTFDPLKNRELLQRGLELEKMVNSKNTERLYKLTIWDEQLHRIIEPMERNLSFLKIIYPVAVAVFSLIGLALNFLILILRAKEAAIMRVLGCTKNKVRIIFTTEHLLLCIMGTISGLIITASLHGGVSISTLINILIYLVSCIAGTISASYSVTNKVPLELLQVKE